MRRALALARRAWPAVRKVAPAVLAVIVVVLVGRQAAGVDWPAVRDAIGTLSPAALAGALALAVVGHAAFAAYDVVGRRVVGHGASAARSWAIGAVSYPLNLNVGSFIGGVAVRLRLYERAGVSLGDGGQVVALGMAGNWLGWSALAGTVLAVADPLPWPQGWTPPADGWRYAASALLLAVPAAALAACALGRRSGRNRAWHWRGHALARPGAGAAAALLALSMTSWALAGVIVWLLTGGQAPLPSVIGAMLLAAVAGVITHVPAGLGVLEAVCVATLGGIVPQPVLLAGLLAYRALYYLLPLAAAGAGYAALEAMAGRSSADASRKGQAASTPGASACSSAGTSVPGTAGSVGSAGS